MSRDKLLGACVRVIEARSVLENIPEAEFGKPGFAAWHNATLALNERWRDLHRVLAAIPVDDVLGWYNDDEREAWRP